MAETATYIFKDENLHYYIKLYTKEYSSAKSYDYYLGQITPTDTSEHSKKLNYPSTFYSTKFEFIAEEGYCWNKGDKVYYGGGNYVDYWSVACTSDNTTAIVSDTAYQPYSRSTTYSPWTFTANSNPTKQATTEYTITQTLENCTSDYTESTIDTGTHTITLTANEGYSFTQNGSVIIGSTTSVIVASGEKIQSIEVNVTDNVILTMSAQADPTKYKLTQNLTNCTSSLSGDTITEGEHTLQLTSKGSTYTFQTDGTIQIGDDTYTIPANNLTVLAYQFNATGDVTVNMGAKLKPTEYSYTQTLTNCTSNYNESTITEGEHTITLTAKDGYVFTDNGYYTTQTTRKTIVASGTDTQVVTINVTGVTKLVMSASEQTTTYYNITQNLSNCTSSYVGTTIPEGTTVITLTCNDGFIFSEAGALTIGGSVYEIPANNSTIVQVSVNATDDVTITMVGRSVPKSTYTIKQTLTNCTSDYTDSTITEGEHTITLTATNGYYFDTDGTLVIGSSSTAIAHSSASTQVITLNATGNITITMSASKQIVSLSSFNHLYSVNNDILAKISAIRYYSVDNVYSDYGRFITNLYKLPFDITDIIDDEDKIVLGYYTSSVTAPQINGYMVTVDMGTIDCTMPYGNVYDYDTCECRLFIPYFNTIDLDVRDCVNKTLHIVMVVDLYSGYGNLIVYANDLLIHTENKIVVQKIPFIQEQTGITLTQDILTYNSITTPTVVITNNTPYELDNTYGRDCDKNVYIKNVKGYCEFDKVSITSEIATPSELDKIETLLKSGVTIK